MFRTYGILLNPGPGDCLRFVHGFCEIIKALKTRGFIFCTTDAWIRCGTMLSAMRTNTEIVLCSSFSEVNKHLKLIEPSIIWHCYEIGILDPITKKLPLEITEYTAHTYAFIDRRTQVNYMRGSISENLPIPKDRKIEKGLLFIRDMHVRPERNTNTSILSGIVTVAKENDLEFCIIGSELRPDWKEIIDGCNWNYLYEGNYPDYYSQMIDYSKFLIAVGMNSGGLDLAIASGVPAIRIGEFHQYYSWLGRDYNLFLSSAPTVNIESLSETDISNIGAEKIETAFSLCWKDSIEIVRWVKA